MAKNSFISAYGFEKPYLEEIEKEISQFSDLIYYDSFDNLIAVKNPNSKEDVTKTVLFCFSVSDNSFMVNEIKDDGKAVISSLKGYCDEYNGKKAVTNSGKCGYIKADSKNKKLECDFGYDNEKTASKYIKCGDILSIKLFWENIGDAVFTNAPHIVLKNIFLECIGDYYNKKVIFAFIREEKKGAFALGKNLNCDEAYFLCFSEDTKENLSFIKKEGSFISDLKTELNSFVTDKDISFASQYFLSSGINNVCGIALKKENIGNGIFKIKKETINETIKFIKG